MKTIEIEDNAYEAIQLAAKVSGRTPAAVISKLVAQVADGQAPLAAHKSTASEPAHLAGMTDETSIYSSYLGQRTDAVLDPVRETVRITSGPLAGELFNSPSAAGIKLVETLKPGRKFSNTNGWRFWRLTSNGELIDTLRRVR